MPEPNAALPQTRKSIDNPYAVSGAGIGGRIVAFLRRRLAPFIDGYEEHGWSGKLFLLNGGLGIAGSVLGWSGAVLLNTLRLGLLRGMGLTMVAGLVGLPFLRIWYRYLLGVARFERWTLPITVVLSACGAISGLGLLTGRMGWRTMLIVGAQSALSVQYLVYFLRERHRFVVAKPARRVRAAKDLPAPPTPAPATDKVDDSIASS